MAKLLSILRHAKSDWDNPDLRDHDRPLNRRGSKNAPELGILLRAEGLVPDRIIASSAQRAQQTAKLVMQSMNAGKELLQTDPDLYLASPSDLLAAAANCNDAAEHLMLVAHNPGMTQLINDISDVTLDNLPTCGVFCIELPIQQWQDIADSPQGKLRWHHYPKMRLS